MATKRKRTLDVALHMYLSRFHDEALDAIAGATGDTRSKIIREAIEEKIGRSADLIERYQRIIAARAALKKQDPAA